MEDNNKSYSADGRKLRPRKKVSFDGAEKRSEGGYGHRYHEGGRSANGGERRNYGGERKPYGERRSFGEGGERKPYGERRSYGENRPYGERSNFAEGGERRSYNGGERKPYGEHRSYGEHRTYNGGERKPYGERRSFGENRPYGERSSFAESGERRPYNGGERKPYGERRSFGEHKPYNGGERRPYGERRNSGDRKPSGGRGGYGRPQGGYHKRFEPQFDERSEEGINQMISRRPQLDASQYSDNDYIQTPIQEEIRLNKFIANSGVCSRREADTFIQAGVVTVNGEVVTELGTKVNVINDDIRFNGQRLKGEEKVYIVMNKPKGYVTTSSDPHAEKTVMDLLKGCEVRVFPVGRLDKATTGVLMFTNDGEIAEKLTHPSYDKKKIYQVILDKELSQEDYEKILSGIELSDGQVAADELEYIDAEDHRRLGIEIHSGKNRIVRRIFESLGYDVRALDRVYFAGLTKKGISKGEWRYLTEGEVNILKMGAYV
ncbi:MAG: pseudouridine synthase [Bacteroidia bacterium]|nr:pseudouridine synthase [Bacteroidia bacterium]